MTDFILNTRKRKMLSSEVNRQIDATNKMAQIVSEKDSDCELYIVYNIVDQEAFEKTTGSSYIDEISKYLYDDIKIKNVDLGIKKGIIILKVN